MTRILFAFVLITLVLTQTAVFATYGIYDLNSVGGMSHGVGKAINDRGLIVGACGNAEVGPSVEIPFVFAGQRGILPLAGGYGSALTINGCSGLIGGYLKTPGGQNAVLWNGNTTAIYAVLPSLGGPRSSVLCMNDTGPVVGWSTVYSGYAIQKRAVQWDRNTGFASVLLYVDRGDHSGIIEISAYADAGWTVDPIGPTLTGYQANSVSNQSYNVSENLIHNTIVGQRSSENYTGFSVRDGMFQFDAGTLTGVNTMGQICGYGLVSGQPRAFFEEGNGQRTYMDLFPRDVRSYAMDINDKIAFNANENFCFADPLAIQDREINVDYYQHDVQIVGYSEDALGTTHAFVWTKGGGVIYLSDFGFGGTKALSINEFFEICGSAADSEGKTRAVKWQKIDDLEDPPRSLNSKSSSSDSDDFGKVSLEDALVISNNIGAGNHRFSYVKSPQFLTAIRVEGSFGLTRGEIVTLEGRLRKKNNELVLKPISKLLYAKRRGEMPASLGFTNGGVAGTARGVGPMFSGLATVWGTVLAVQTDSIGLYLLIDDGSHFVEREGYPVIDQDGNPVLDADGNPVVVPPIIGIRVYPKNGASVPIGEKHIFKGIKGNQYGISSIWDAEVQ